MKRRTEIRDLVIGYAYFFALGMLVSMVIAVVLGRLSSAGVGLALAVGALALGRWLSTNPDRVYRLFDPDKRRSG